MVEPRSTQGRAARWPWWLLVLSLAIAANLRLTRLGLAPFCVDQVSVLRMVRGLLDGTYIPRRGPDIGPGLFEWGTLGPLEYYVMAPLVVLAEPALGAPTGPLAAFVLFGLLGFPSLYLLGERHLGRGVGAVACFLYAVAPHPFYLSRELMDHSFLAPVVPLFFLALCELSRRASVGWAAVACGSLAAAMQFHITTVVFLPILIVVLVTSRVSWRGWVAGLAVGAALYAPFLYAQLTEGFPDVRAMLGVARGQGIGIASSRAGSTVFTRLVEILYRSGQTPDIETPVGVHRLGAGLAVAVASGAALALGRAGYALLRRDSAPREPRGWLAPAIVVAWLALPMGFLATQRTEVYARHLAIIYPAPQLLASLLVTGLFGCATRRTPAPTARWAGRMVAALAATALLAWVSSGIWTILRFQRDVQRGSLVAGKLPLGVEQDLARELVARGVRASTFDRVGLAGGGQELEGIHYLVERLAPAPGGSGNGHSAFLIAAPTDVIDDPVLRFLGALGWKGDLALIEHRSSLDADTLQVTRNGHPAARADLTSYGTGDPGPIHAEARITKLDGERILLVVDTHVCIERVEVGGLVAFEHDCAGAAALPWPVRSAIELPPELPPGQHTLVIDAENPVKRLYLALFDLTVPGSGLPTVPEGHGLQIMRLD